MTRKQLDEKTVPALKNKLHGMITAVRQLNRNDNEYTNALGIIKDAETLLCDQSNIYKPIADCDAFAREWTACVNDLQKVADFYVRFAANDMTKHYARKITLADLNKRTSEITAELQNIYDFLRRPYRSNRAQFYANAMCDEIKTHIKTFSSALNVYNADPVTYGNNDFDLVLHRMEVQPIKYKTAQKIILDLNRINTAL